MDRLDVFSVMILLFWFIVISVRMVLSSIEKGSVKVMICGVWKLI